MKLWPFILTAMILVLIYILYYQGIAVSKRIRAVLHVFRRGKDADRVMLGSCTGWVKHVGRFPESRTYEFTFDGQLSKGDVDVLLLDKKRHPLLKLNCQSPVGRVELDGKSRYYIRWEYKSATGECVLHW